MCLPDLGDGMHGRCGAAVGWTLLGLGMTGQFPELTGLNQEKREGFHPAYLPQIATSTLFSRSRRDSIQFGEGVSY